MRRPLRSAMGWALVLLAGTVASSVRTDASPTSETCSDSASTTVTQRRPGTGAAALLDTLRVLVPDVGAPSRGPLSARVTIVEFSDFQCPSCALNARLMDSVATAFPRDVRIVFKQFPLEFHEHSFEAAEASVAAQEQGKFWEMHDRMFAHPHEIDRHSVMGWACELSLDVTSFSRGLYAGQFRERVLKDIEDGDRLRVHGTPTIFVDGRRYLGDRLMAELAPVLRELIAVPSGSPIQAKSWKPPVAARSSTGRP